MNGERKKSLPFLCLPTLTGTLMVCMLPPDHPRSFFLRFEKKSNFFEWRTKSSFTRSRKMWNEKHENRVKLYLIGKIVTLPSPKNWCVLMIKKLNNGVQSNQIGNGPPRINGGSVDFQARVAKPFQTNTAKFGSNSFVTFTVPLSRHSLGDTN